MAITVGDALVRFGVDMAEFKRDITDAEKHVKTRMERMGGSIRKAGLAFTAFGAVGLAVGGMLVKAASDAEESRAKFDTVFGFMADDVAEWAETTSRAMQRSRNDFIEWLAALQDTFVPLGFARDEAAAFAKTLVELTVDVASFQNVAEADVLRDFQSAIVGNHETVRKYGIIITEASLQQEILNNKWAESKAEITDAMKVQGRLNLIMAGTTDAQGDAIRTADSFANTARALTSQLSDMAADLGANLLPMLSQLIGQVGKVVMWFRDWTKENPELTGWIIKIGAGLAALSLVLGPILIILPTLVTSIGMVTAAMKLMWLATMGPVGIVIALGILGGILLATVLKMDKTSDATAGLRKQLVDLHGPTSDVVTKFDELTASGLDAAAAMKEMAKESTEMAAAALAAAEAQLALLRLQTATINELRGATRGASKDAVDAYDRERLALVDTIRQIRAQLAGLGQDTVDVAETTTGALKTIDDDYVKWLLDTTQEQHDIRVQALLDTLEWKRTHYLPEAVAIVEDEFEAEKQALLEWEAEKRGIIARAQDEQTTVNLLRDDFEVAAFDAKVRAIGEAENRANKIRLADNEYMHNLKLKQIEEEELAELRLKKITEGLAAEERARLMTLLGSGQITRARAPSGRQVAFAALAAGGGPLRTAAGQVIGAQAAGLLGGRGAPPLLPGVPGYGTANITIELDGVKIGEVVGQQITDTIRIRQGGAVD